MYFGCGYNIAWPRDTSAAVTCRNLSKLLLPSSLKGQNPQASFESWDGWGAGRVFRRGSRKSLARRRRRLAAPPIGRSDVCSDLCIVVSALTICRAGERIEVPAAGRQDHRSSPRRSPAPMAAETRTRRQWGAHRRNWGSRGSSRGRRHPHGIGPNGQGLSWRPWQASPWWATKLDTANCDWIVGLPRHRSDDAWCPRRSAPGGLVILGNRDKVPFIRACWPDDNLLAEPVNAVGPDDRKLLLVSVRSLGEGSPGSLIHPLVLGRLFVVPETVLLDQGSQLEYGISAEMRRSLDLPIVCRALARHPGPPKKNVGLLERIQDQLIVLEHGGGGAVPICGCARPPPRE